MTSRALVLAVVTGCGSASTPAAAPPPITQPTAPAAVDAPRDAASVEVEELAAPTPSPVVAADCSGAVVTLASREACVVSGESRPIPSSITMTIEPAPLRLRSGAELAAAVVLTNTSRDEVVLMLDCSHLWEPTYEMHDRRGHRVDVEGACGPGGGGCGGPTYGFALPPQGQARLDFVLAARKHEACGGGRGGAAMSKGSYTLRVDSGLGTVSTKIQIH